MESYLLKLIVFLLAWDYFGMLKYCESEGESNPAAILPSALAAGSSAAECSFCKELVGWLSSHGLKHLEFSLLKTGTNFPCLKGVLY